MQPFSCSSKSTFRLAPKHCEGNDIFGNLNEVLEPQWGEWRPVTNCVSKSCMIPAKGIRIFTRLCENSLTNKLQQSAQKEGTRRKVTHCAGEDTLLQICSATHNIAGCSKLITPSQFASNKCSQYQVNVLNGNVK